MLRILQLQCDIFLEERKIIKVTRSYVTVAELVPLYVVMMQSVKKDTLGEINRFEFHHTVSWWKLV